jgi:hypothetical protein
MSRRMVDLEHVCQDCDEWVEVWQDDPDAAILWTDCPCAPGYASRAQVLAWSRAYLDGLAS